MATNWNLTYRLRDSRNAAAPMLFYGQVATAEPDPLASMQAAHNALAPLVDACTQSVIEQAIASVSLSMPSGLKTAPVAGSFNTTVGNIDYDGNPTSDGWTMTIPNLLDALINGNAKQISNVAPLLALSNKLIDQTVGNANFFTDEDRNFLLAYFYGSTSTRRYRRAYNVRPQRNRALG